MKPDIEHLIPMKPGDFQILLVLLRENTHGYGIMKVVSEQTDGAVRLEIGSLYRILARMMDLGLVETSKTNSEETDRRRFYSITQTGRLAAQLEARRLESLIKTARSVNLLGPS